MNRTEPDEIVRGIDPAVLTLLERGAPENGVDLADWWRTREPAELRRAVEPRRVSWPLAGGMLAAGLLVGLALGGLGIRWTFGGESARRCEYSAVQRNAMMETLAVVGEARQTMLAKRQTELAGCVACHPALRSAPVRSGQAPLAALVAVALKAEGL